MATINFPTTANVGQVYNANTKAWTWTGYGWKAVNASGSLVSSNVITYTATSGQTSFTTPTYVQGANQVSIFVNGVRQHPSEFAESTNTTITLSNGATLNDSVLIQVEGYTGNPIAIGLPTILDDIVTNATRYPLMAQSTSGSLTLVNTASTDFTFNASTNILFVPTLQFNDGTTISTSFTAAGSYANSAYAQANGASIYANGAFIQANASYGQANSAALYANGAFIQANAAFIKANTPDAIANSAALYANGAFIQANAAFTKANSAIANTSGVVTAGNFVVSGNLGVGITPSYPLHISAAQGETYLTSSTGTNLVRHIINNTGGTFQFGIDNSTGSNFFGATAYGRAIFSDGAYPLGIFTNGSERMRIDPTGNVYIGTTSATWNEKLSVSLGSSSPNANVGLGIYHSAGSGYTGSMIRVQAETTGTGWKMYEGRATGGGVLYWVDGTGAGYFAGNMAIGTTSVAGSSNGLTVTKSQSLVGSVSTIRGVGNSPSFELLNYNNTQNWYFGINDADSAKLYIGRGYGPNQNVTPSIVVNTSDSVGIGVTSPTSYFHIKAGAAAASSAPLKLTSGTNQTTAEAGAVEYDGSFFYATPQTTNGRQLIPTTNYYVLSADASAVGAAIAQFFPGTTAIPLVASGVYEIEFNCWFLKTTAGTLVWTLTNSTTVTKIHADMQMSPIAGVTSTNATSELFAQVANQTAASVAFAATGSLTTGVNHFMRMRVYLVNGSSTSLRLNVTNSAGTVTPLAGSFWKARRIATVGTLAA
jgi:hypothetical protein